MTKTPRVFQCNTCTNQFESDADFLRHRSISYHSTDGRAYFLRCVDAVAGPIVEPKASK